MGRLQNGTVDSLVNLLTNSQDQITGLPLEFSASEDAQGVPVYTCSVTDKDNKQVRGYSFSPRTAQCVVSVTTEEIKEKEEAPKATATSSKK